MNLRLAAYGDYLRESSGFMANASTWVFYFEKNAMERSEPDWSLPVVCEECLRPILAESLSHFQLGESGDGGFLFRKLPQEADSDYLRCLEFFVREEQEHARLLKELVQRFGGKLLNSHWTDTLFCLIRRMLTFSWEIQILLTAEIIGTAYYKLVGEKCSDPILKQVCQLIEQDEVKHLQFHQDHFIGMQASDSAMVRRLWNGQFTVIGFLVAHVAWIDHGRCLKALGASRQQFLQEIRKLQEPLLMRVQ